MTFTLQTKWIYFIFFCILHSNLGGKLQKKKKKQTKQNNIQKKQTNTENMEDTSNTLRYALKAKSIVCKVICNEQPSAKMVESM